MELGQLYVGGFEGPLNVEKLGELDVLEQASVPKPAVVTVYGAYLGAFEPTHHLAMAVPLGRLFYLRVNPIAGLDFRSVWMPIELSVQNLKVARLWLSLTGSIAAIINKSAAFPYSGEARIGKEVVE